MKKIVVLALLSFQWLCGEAPSFEYTTESSHFRLACTEGDRPISSSLLKIAEEAYAKYVADFAFDLDKKIELFIYPSIEFFHEALGLSHAPAWLVANATDHDVRIVSPSNPGPCHSEKSLRMILKLEIAETFIKNCSTGRLPRWLLFGFAALEGDYHLKSLQPVIPTLDQLETWDNEQFAKVNGFQWSYLFVSFIAQKYGKDKLVQLVKDYTAFQQIMGISKEEMYQLWLESASSGS